MPLYVESAEVFDPALSGDSSLPVRLELHVVGLPDEPTFTDLGNKFSVMHYSWLQRIYSEEWDWSETDNMQNAAIYNSSLVNEDREAVFPVTVFHGDIGDEGFGEEYFIRISRAKRILRHIEREQGHGGYELLPDPTYIEEKKIAWYLQHSNRQCVECVQERAKATHPGSTVDIRQIPDMCKVYKAKPHRLVTLCAWHGSVLNETRKAERLFLKDDEEATD